MRTRYIQNNLQPDNPGLNSQASRTGFIEGIVFSLLASSSVTIGLAGSSLAISVITGAVSIGLSVGISFLANAIFAPKQPKPEDGQVSIKNPTAARGRHYGRVKMTGTWVFAETNAGSLYKVIALGTGELDAIEEYWLDDTHVTLDGSGRVQEWPWKKAANLHWVHIQSRLGLATETAYGGLTARFPEWTSTHRGDGVSSLFATQVAIEAEQLSELFPNVAHTLYRVVARGSKVYNPSTGLTAWSDNAAAVIRDYMTHADGMRLPVSLMTTTQATAGWLAAYNRANEDVTLAAGGTEKRYRLWGSYRFDERPADVLSRMLLSCDGRIVPTPDGGVTLDIGDWEEPTVVIDADMITGFSEVGRGRDILTTANVISATYTSTEHDYQATDANRWEDDPDIALRGEIVSDMAFNMSPSHAQCRRLMKLSAYRANPSWIGTFQCNLKALAGFAKRFVRIEYPLFDIDDVFEVLDFRFNIGEGGILIGVTLQVQSMPEEAYEWDAATEEGTGPISEHPVVDTTIPVPTGFTFTTDFIDVSGTLIPFGVIAFDVPPDGLNVQGRYKLVSGDQWNSIPVPAGETEAQTNKLSDGQEYEAQVRHISPTGRAGEWTDSEYTIALPSLDFSLASNSQYFPLLIGV